MAPATWDIEAIQRFPDLVDRFEGITSVYALWNELTDIFKEAYRQPKNDDLIARIYDYANWCCSQPEGTTAQEDLGTCVCTCFYEEIPTCAEAIKDMPRWFSHSDVLIMKPIFSYMVGEQGFQQILAAYDSLPKEQRKAAHRA